MNRKTTLVSSLALTLAVRSAFAVDPFVAYTAGTTYTQNFNSLWTNSTTPPQNLEDSMPVVQISSAVGAPVDLTGPSADAFTTIPQISTMTGWYAVNFGGNSVALKYNVNDGSSNTTGVTAYYDPAKQASGNNLALGAITASESGNVLMGMKLVNNGTTSLNAISLSYTGQLFHQDTGSKSLVFGYTIDPTNSLSIPTSGYTGYGALNVGGFDTGTSSAMATSATTSQSLSVINLPLSSDWAPGSALWITWQAGVGGGGQGLGIDDLSFSATRLTGASTLIWNSTTSGNWDTSTPNWTGAATTFVSGTYNASFGATNANLTITVDAAGIAVANSLTINNSGTGSYTFTGGSIAGAGASLTVAGNGTVILTAANSYGFATNVTGGTLVVSNNNQLGASSAALNLSGGTLKLAGALSAGNRTLTVSAAGATIDLAGFNASFGNTTAFLPVIHGTLHVTGGADLNLGIQPTFGNAASPAGKLVIDAGSTVTLKGNSRSSATDMYDGGIINGNLILDTTSIGARFNFNSPGAIDGIDHNGASKFTGTGEIQVIHGSGWVDSGSGSTHKWNFDTNGICICNTSATFAAEIDVDIHLNPLADSDPVGHPFHRLDVTTANFTGASNPNSTNSFGTVIGGTKISTAGHGPNFSNLLLAGVIKGHSDINIGNDYKSGGSGDVTFKNHMTYDGVTMFNGGGTLYTAVDDALPTDTDLIFGAFSGAGAAILDLAGHSQHVRSIEVGLGTNSPQSQIIQNSGNADATLFVTGNITTFYPYNAQLNDGGQASDGSFGTHKLALAKSGSGTLVLGQYLSAGHTTLSTYSGGTTVSGGSLQISFDGALGDASGNLTLDGGILNVQNPLFIGDAGGTENTVSLTTSRHLTVTANGGSIITPAFTAKLQFGNQTVNLVEPVTFTGDGGYSWAGTLQYTGSTTGTVSSSLTINGGAGSVAVTGNAAVQNNANSFLFVGGASDPFTDSSDSSKHVALINNGNFTLTSGAKSVGPITGTGNTTINAATSLTAKGIVNNALTLNGNLTLASGSNGSKLNSLSIAGKLDLANNALALQTTSPGDKSAKITALIGLIAAGRNGGNWLGATGITSSTAAAAPSGFGSRAVGLFNNADLTTPLTFLGTTPVDTTSLIIATTFNGDANLDGKVDLIDLTAIANHWQTSQNTWSLGDITLDGFVDINDLTAVANNWQAGVGPNFTGTQSFAAAMAGLTFGVVPEPTSLGLLGLGGMLLLKRKRR